VELAAGAAAAESESAGGAFVYRRTGCNVLERIIIIGVVAWCDFRLYTAFLFIASLYIYTCGGRANQRGVH